MDRQWISGDRQEKLCTLFKQKYGQEADFLARAPGRVNLIGEHIDYHGYSVLPMALTQDILMAVSRNQSNEINLANINEERYDSYTCSTSHLAIDKRKPLWYHYILCGIKGCLETLPEGYQLQGMNIFVDGEVPPNAGLSSSSALVCCAALASFQANKIEISRKALASLCAQAERYIGTEGGGMDQAISLLAQAGKAKLIEFDPLRSTDVTLPGGGVFVVANCCVELNKAATSHFNTRVAEGRVGVALIAHAKHLNWKEIKKAKVLQELLNLSLNEMLDLVEVTLHDDPYSISEAASLLEISDKEFTDLFLSDATQDLQSFQSKKRLRYIFNESARVSAFHAICMENGSSEKQGVLAALGDLMYESHASGRYEYQCSCEDLDELVRVMMDNGAYGARLTGAGWGGCAVALIDKGKVEEFLRNVKDDFFTKNSKRLERLNDSIFVTSPGDGAQIYSKEVSVLQSSA